MSALVDTSVLYALTDRTEAKHQACVTALTGETEAIILPQPVLVEICYLINARLGAATELAFLEGLLASDWRLEPLTDGDVKRATRLLETYAQADLGFVDAAVVAVAERLTIRRVYSLDRRDFAIVRPSHADAFEVLP